MKIERRRLFLVALSVVFAFVLLHRSSQQHFLWYSWSYLFLILLPATALYALAVWLLLMQPERARTIGLRIVQSPPFLILASLALVGVVGEVVLRIHDFGYVMPSEFNESGYTSHVPNTEFIYEGAPLSKKGFRTKVVWNSSGWHDWDYSVQKPPGAERIIVVGDSWVEARQVEVFRTFHKRLERKMNGTLPGKYQVMAFGYQGTGQVRQLEWIQDPVLRYDPDLVVLFFYAANDVWNNSDMEREMHPVVAWVSPLMKVFRDRGLNFPTLVFSYLNRYVLTVRGSEGDEVYVPPSLNPETGASWEAAWQRTFDAIRAMRDQLAAENVPFAVVGIPAGEPEIDAWRADSAEHTLEINILNDELAPAVDLRYPNRRMAEFCAEEGIPFIDLNRRLARSVDPDTTEEMFFDHWTPVGHEIVARELFDPIVELLHADGTGS